MRRNSDALHNSTQNVCNKSFCSTVTPVSNKPPQIHKQISGYYNVWGIVLKGNPENLVLLNFIFYLCNTET